MLRRIDQKTEQHYLTHINPSHRCGLQRPFQSAQSGGEAMALACHRPCCARGSGPGLQEAHAGDRARNEIHLLVEAMGGEIDGSGGNRKEIAALGLGAVTGAVQQMLANTMAAMAIAHEKMVQIHARLPSCAL